MRRATLYFVLVLCLTGIASAAVSLKDWMPNESAFAGTGGPDLYGYIWIDSAEPGGPVFAWRDISGVGTLVTGLGDDNYVGPFPIGFSFHYYWYDVNLYWIGSNGYLEFGPPFNAAQPFPNNIPLTTPPNNFLACYMADFDLSVGGTCHRWNNADSLIVQFTNVPAWNYGGSHTFQIILSRLDSCITNQYSTQTGTVSNNDILVGIENVSGTIGLKHSNDVPPPPNNAIKFVKPANPIAVVHDLEAKAAANANSEGFFVFQNIDIMPWGRIKNVGNMPEQNFTVNCTILRDGAFPDYNQTKTYVPPFTLAAGAELDVNFAPPVWQTQIAGTYSYKITVNLVGDMNPNNNQKITECHVITMPGQLLYDDGSSEQAWSWQGGAGGLAQRFVPPNYPVRIDWLHFFLAGGGGPGSSFFARILDDDGLNGSPGTSLWTSQPIIPDPNFWSNAYLVPQNIHFGSGSFYVAWIMNGEQTPPLGIDNTAAQPVSRQGWEYTGGWAPFRNLEISDIMIRADISVFSSAVEVTITPVNPPIQIAPGGGEFGFDGSARRNSYPNPNREPFYVWTRDRFPNGTYYGPTLGPVAIDPPIGVTVSRLRTQNVPGSWPPGIHTYIGYAHSTYSYPATDSSYFTFTKLADGPSGPFVWDDNCYGEPFPYEVGATRSVVSEFALIGASPNPFNASTTISYTLQAASQVSLNAYDVSGRLVSTLVDGWREAGSHQVTFDGSGLASGIYLYSLKAGRYSFTGKMVLMK